MKIGNLSNINFKSVYAVSGSKEQIVNLHNNLLSELNEEKALLLLATDIYEGSKGNGFCSKSVRDGKEVSFFVTGKNIKDVLFMHHGWGSLNGISQHIDNCYEIKDDKKAADYFKTVAQKDWKKDNKDNKDKQ